MQNFQLLVADDEELLERIGCIEVQFSPEFIKWNASIVSHSEEELRQKKVGMLASGSKKLSSNLVSITKSGMKVAAKIEERITQWETEYWDGLLTEKEKACCLSALQTMSQRILKEGN